MREDLGVFVTERQQAFDRSQPQFRMLCGFAFGSRSHDHRDDEDDADERPEDGRVPAELSQLRKEREQVREGPLEWVEREEKNDVNQDQQRAPILLPDYLFGDPIN